MIDEIRKQILDKLREDEAVVLPIVKGEVDEAGREPRAYARGRLFEIMEIRKRVTEILDSSE
jgi:hypothetical protein